jgi:hypothetical protein
VGAGEHCGVQGATGCRSGGVQRERLHLHRAQGDDVPLDSATGRHAERGLCRPDDGVIVLPGSGLGAGGEGFFRVSFITSPDRIAEAAGRAGQVLRG